MYRVIHRDSNEAKEVVCRTAVLENTINNIELYSFHPSCAEQKVYFSMVGAEWKDCQGEGKARICKDRYTINNDNMPN